MSRVAAGVDIGGTKVAVGLVDEAGRLIAHCAEPLDLQGGEAPALQAVRLVRALVGETLAPPGAAQAPAAPLPPGAPSPHDLPLAGVGVGVPGLPVTEAGGVWAPNIPGWDNFPLVPLLRRELGGLPVAVENDGRCAALGEAWAGAGRGAVSAVLITIGTGIGGGVILDGKVVGGRHGVAGAFGWLPAEEAAPAHDGPLIGPLERSAAGPALNAVAARLGLGGAPELFDACRQGHVQARVEVELFAERLAGAIAGIVAVVDPEVVILGGGVSANFSVFEPFLHESLRRAAHPFARRLRLAPAALGAHAGVVGAARLILG